MAETAVLRVLGSLTLVVIAILALAWFARRTGWAQGKPQHRLKVLSSQRLGARSQITIVEVDNTQLVLGVTPTQISLLHTLPARDTVLDAYDTCPDTALNTRNPRPCPPLTRAASDPRPDALPAQSALASRSDASSARSAPEPAESCRHPFKRLLARKLLWLLVPVLLTLSILPEAVVAQTALPALTLGPTGADGSQTWSLSIQTLMLLTMMSFLPAMLLTMTGFTRIIIVLGLLRNAMGTGASPPNSVLIGLALFLTFFTMSPVFDQVYSTAWQPLSEGRIQFDEALSLGAEPLREFMFHQTREADLSLFANMANVGEFQSPDQVPLRVLVPSFVTSELKTAFQIGFTIFIPFLIIDLVIASILMSLGMMMVPPVTISLPFKLMLFVLADGWHLLLGSLARSFYQ